MPPRSRGRAALPSAETRSPLSPTGAPPIRPADLIGDDTPPRVFSVTSFGAKGDGKTDDTAAIRAAINAAGSSAVVSLPGGTYYVTDTITIGNSYVALVGEGTNVTRFVFDPAAGSAGGDGKRVLFKFSAGQWVLFGNRISDMSFFAAPGNQQTKVAIQLNDTSGAIVRNIDVDPVGRFTSTWKGANSIGIQLRGREQTVVDHINIAADKPIEISTDPNTPYIGCDHLHLSNTFLAPTPGTGGAAVTIDDGVVVLNLTIDGYNAWLPDKYGLYWNDTSTQTVSLSVKIQGVRCEQSIDASGTSLFISARDQSARIQNLDIDDFRASAGQNAIYLRGVNTATIRNSSFPSADETKKHLDVADTYDLSLVNNYVQEKAQTSISGMTKVFGLPRRMLAATMGPTEHWSAAVLASATVDSVGALELGAKATSCVIGSPTVPVSFPGGLTLGAGTHIVGEGELGIGSSNGVRYFIQKGGDLVPGASNVYSLGSPSAFMAQAFMARPVTLPQVLDAAPSLTVRPWSGDKVRINLSATPINSVAILQGNDGEHMVVCVAQDGAGWRSIPTSWINVRFAGGSYVASTGANKIDCVQLEYDQAASAWLEIGRTMNL